MNLQDLWFSHKHPWWCMMKFTTYLWQSLVINFQLHLCAMKNYKFHKWVMDSLILFSLQMLQSLSCVRSSNQRKLTLVSLFALSELWLIILCTQGIAASKSLAAMRRPSWEQSRPCEESQGENIKINELVNKTEICWIVNKPSDDTVRGTAKTSEVTVLIE
jgi:hypothetical protein